MNRKSPITIRPRVNSALERIHTERRKEFPDLVHKWAEAEANTPKTTTKGKTE